MKSPRQESWLSRCEGFVVDSPGGRVGTVEDVRFGSRADLPDALGVRAGLLGRRLLIVSTETVAAIVPSSRRIVLRGTPVLLGTESLATGS